MPKQEPTETTERSLNPASTRKTPYHGHGADARHGRSGTGPAGLSKKHMGKAQLSNTVVRAGAMKQIAFRDGQKIARTITKTAIRGGPKPTSPVLGAGEKHTQLTGCIRPPDHRGSRGENVGGSSTGNSKGSHFSSVWGR